MSSERGDGRQGPRASGERTTPVGDANWTRSFDNLVCTVEDRVARVTLNRPHVLNAVNNGLLHDLIEVFELINRSDEAWCVVLSGAGRAFCVGADQKERPGMSLDEVRERRRIAPMAFSAMRNCLRPVIAQVHGYALGSGLEIALGCDMIFAEAGTVMGLVETARGSIPAGGGTQLLARYVGVAKAKELIFTGSKFTAEDAEKLGLLNGLLPAGELAAETERVARRVVTMAPIANIQAKRAINMSLDVGVTAGIQIEAAYYERILATSDRAEALTAYRNHRDPNFAGS